MTENTIINFSDATIALQYNLILNDVNLSVKKGEFVYLIGKTGSGKSTLLRTLYADVELYQGECTVAGFNLKTLRRKDIPYLRRKLGVVFQDFQLLMDRMVQQNLIFVLKATGWNDKKKIEEKILEVLTMVGMETKLHKMPHELSGGEQQRIAIARALLNDPEIILADEPTGNLDPETSDGIMKILFNISNSGRSVLMATHDYALIRKFPSRILECAEGKITEMVVAG
ncbi:MAG: ATP-binding cassette domain-containing protein [Bacteroidetes bacterium]|nr:ATP-binding cassette domain-containing protein [Bacteroidota bacterium]MBU1717619.1 ATP-binding cassette domain-containing protein [Bacteroidota bacterium]